MLRSIDMLHTCVSRVRRWNTNVQATKGYGDRGPLTWAPPTEILQKMESAPAGCVYGPVGACGGLSPTSRGPSRSRSQKGTRGWRLMQTPLDLLLVVLGLLLLQVVQVARAQTSAPTLAPTRQWLPVGSFPMVDFEQVLISSTNNYGPETSPVVLAVPQPNITDPYFSQVRPHRHGICTRFLSKLLIDIIHNLSVILHLF